MGRSRAKLGLVAAGARPDPVNLLTARKLDAPFGAEVIETVRGVGYRLRTRPLVPGGAR